jgi:O-antigen ligase
MFSLTQSDDGRASVQLRAPRVALLDVLGAALFLGAAAWTTWASVRAGGSAAPIVGLLLACGLVVVAARSIGSRARFIVPLAVLLAAAIVAARSRTGVLSTAPLSGPLEYLNADGAFYVQAAIAGLMLVASARPWPFRALGGLGAAFFAALPFIVHAVAAAWLVVVLPGIGMLSAIVAGARGARASVALFGLLFIASVTATILLGSTYSRTAEPSLFQRAAANTVEEDRLVLWHDAFVIMRDHPGTGVGPRRYEFVSPIASGNPDYRWAHHEFLQQGAEAGITGLVFLAVLFLWGFSRLWVVAMPDAITALSAASLAALGIHACFDYVMHFPAIPVVTAALTATGMIDELSRSTSD